MAKCHAQKKAILKMGQCLGNRCPYSEFTLNFAPWGRQSLYATAGSFVSDQVSCSYMASLKTARKPLPVEEFNKLKFTPPPPRGRKRAYVQLMELWPMPKFHAQTWQFRKSINPILYFMIFQRSMSFWGHFLHLSQNGL